MLLSLAAIAIYKTYTVITGMRKKTKKPDEWNQDSLSRTQLTYSNAEFEAYYRKQNLFPEAEWDVFLDTLKTPLPLTFRVVQNSIYSDASSKFVTSIIEKFPELFSKLEWYPGIAYRTILDKAAIRANPDYKLIVKCIHCLSEISAIYRQEIVSMIPALFLKGHEAVLDMCAAPGSKTSQLLELIPITEKSLVVANDCNFDRVCMLVHRLKGMASPHLVVVSHLAQNFPQIEIDSKPFFFDSVLCDVPCSGDGTFRKNVNLWRTWSTSFGNGLHPLQINILKRAIELCKVGGRVVYSTCSLNPVENEAVVQAVMNASGDSLELLDAKKLIDIPFGRPGLNTWYVYEQEEFFETYEEREKKTKSLIKKTMFPTNTVDLSYCLRFLPQDLNTGGFFIAVLEKVKPVNFDGSISKIESLNTSIQPSTSKRLKLKKITDFDLKSIKISELDIDREELWSKLGGFYGISRTDEKLWQHLSTKQHADNNKFSKVWLANEMATLYGQSAWSKKETQPILYGTPVFDRGSNEKFRICVSFLKHLKKLNLEPSDISKLNSEQVIHIDIDSLRILLNPNDDSKMENPEHATTNEDLKKIIPLLQSPEQNLYRHKFNEFDDDMKAKIDAMKPESYCLVVARCKDNYIPIPGWRGKTNLELLINKFTRFALVSIFNE